MVSTHQFRLGGRPDDLVQFTEEPGQTYVPGDAIFLLHQQVDVISLLHLAGRNKNVRSHELLKERE